MNALAGGLKDDKPTPEFVDVATQINALDGKAAGRAVVSRARRRPERRPLSRRVLLDNAAWPSCLPGDSRRALVQHQLDALR